MATLVFSENVRTLLARGEGYLKQDRDKRTLPEGVIIKRAAGWLLISADGKDEMGRDVTDHVLAGPDDVGEIHEELCDSDSWTRETNVSDQEALVGRLLEQLPPAV